GGNQPVAESAVAAVGNLAGGEGREAAAAEDVAQARCRQLPQPQSRRELVLGQATQPQGPRRPPSSSPSVTDGTRQPLRLGRTVTLRRRGAASTRPPDEPAAASFCNWLIRLLTS